MQRSVPSQTVRALRTRAQGLRPPSDRPSSTTVAGVIDRVEVQAQEEKAAALQVRARSTGLTRDDVERARTEDRAVIRIWLMRGTLHLVTPTNLEWLLPLLGPHFVKAGRRRLLSLWRNEDTLQRGLRELVRALDERPLTREELREHLLRKGLPAAGQASIHLVRYAALQGDLCYGPSRDGKESFVLLRDWIKYAPRPPSDDTLAALTRRYLAGYGPATPADMAAWAGLPLELVLRGWRLVEHELSEVRVDGRTSALWFLGEAEGELESAAGPVQVRLLGRFDTYILGYDDRELLYESAHARRVNAGGGLIRPTLAVDGRFVGTWGLDSRPKLAAVSVEPFGRLPQKAERGLLEETKDVGRFLGISTRLAPNQRP